MTETTIELQNNNNLKTPPVNIQEKLRETLVNPRPLKLNAEQDILSNNISQTTITKKLSKMTKSMAVKNNVKEKRNFSLQNVLEGMLFGLIFFSPNDLCFKRLGIKRI